MTSWTFKLVCGFACSSCSKFYATFFWGSTHFSSQALATSAVGDELSPIFVSHSQQSLLHSPRCQWSRPCPMTATFKAPLSWRLRVLPFQVLFFHVQSRMKDPCSTCCLQSRKRVLCPSASKHIKNSEEITFLLILPLTMRLQRILLMYTFDKMASARPVMELCIFCFVSHHSICPLINHASTKHCRDVCGCLPLILSW